MTLQQLEYFLAAFRHGSFTGAAEELRLAQPSLSEQVRRLEAELGVALFTRLGRGLAAGLAVLSVALVEEGCTDAEFRGPLRSPCALVSACWALDLVLGKS